MDSLKGKKILFISAKFFGYESEITNKLLSLGATVDWYDQRPSNSFLTKVLIRLNNRFLARGIRNYYHNIIEATKSKNYDYVLFISPEVITKSLFLALMETQKGARSIVYMWDSFKNKSNAIREVIPCFDYRFSFDKSDCQTSSFLIKYRPLFFLNSYAEISNHADMEFDLLFIGTVHSDRYRILKHLRELCDQNGLRQYFYMYFPSKYLYYFRRIFDPVFWNSSVHEFKFIPLKKMEIIHYIERSNVVVDIQHPEQIGLTMRTIEMLGARRKLMTTNTDIVNYDFYNSSNINVVSRSRVDIDSSFIKSGMSQLDNDLYRKYSIDGWIDDIFSIG